MTREPGRERLRPKARSEEEQYQWKDITTTSDEACGRKNRALVRLRRRKPVCFVTPTLRIALDTRRSSFLASGTCGAAIAATVHLSKGSKMKKLRTCVVGYGHLGKHHARIHSALEDCEFIGVADPSVAARGAAESAGFKVFADYRELLGRVDAASIATPTETHLEVARDFLDAGVHVLVEKPLALTIDEAKEIAELARLKKLALQVGHIERFNPVIAAVKGKLRNPRFIQADRVSPFSFRSMDIGVVMDVMIHDIDLILYMVKKPVREVTALGVNVLGGSEDIANARILFEGGCTANVTASRVALKTERKVRVFNEDSYVSMDLAKQEAVIICRKRAPSREELDEIKARGASNPLEIMLSNFIEREQVQIEKYEPLAKEIGSFIESVRTGAEPQVTGEDAVEAIRVADMILKSLSTPPWKT
jgi:predicted dehydrogenase